MQFQKDGNYLYSPSDLLDFIECPHLIFLALSGATPPKVVGIPKVLKDNGIDHERKYLKQLRQDGYQVVEIPTEGDLDNRIGATIDALESGADVVFQAVLRDGRLVGRADFLMKCKPPSLLGDHSYEVLDTKLATQPDAKHLTQLCAYVEMLAKIQGRVPAKMHLVTGDDKTHSFYVGDHLTDYLGDRKRFEDYLNSLLVESYPHPCKHCDSCRWKTDCEQQWQRDDHLKLVYNIRKTQCDKLACAGITSVAQLATVSSPVKGLPQKTLEKLKEQADLQTYKRTTGKDKYIVRSDVKEGKGLARLPTSAEGDLFFDIESYPSCPNRLEYLFGVYFNNENQQGVFKTFWAHNHDEEKRAFCQVMQFLSDHLEQYRDAHIYHYHRYETNALKRLVDCYSVCKEQLDDLIQTGKFIDLYAVVRESLRISEPRFSLKNLETFYGYSRGDNVATAGDSVEVYHEWRKTHDPTCLQRIADYNRQDCESTMLLRNWLLGIAGIPAKR